MVALNGTTLAFHTLIEATSKCMALFFPINGKSLYSSLAEGKPLSHSKTFHTL
jgi:uncharacterized alpha/beta hydrolase family protein